MLKSRQDSEGHGLAWWKDYLHDEGFEAEPRTLSDLRLLSDLASLPEGSRAMWVVEIPLSRFLPRFLVSRLTHNWERLKRNGQHDDAVREMLNFVEKNRTLLQGISVKQLIHEGHRL
ncbi:MAG: hypothetical protein WCA20_17965 [Candidatus Sulfotelmatobacter sp.]